MRPSRFAPLIAVAVLAVNSGACSKSSSTAPAITLSQTEVGQLFLEIDSVLTAMGGPALSQTANLKASPLLSLVPGPSFNVMSPISGSASCPAGGTASMSGSASSTTTSESFDITATFNSCKTSSYTVGGSFRETGNASFTSTTISGTISVNGSLSVNASGGRSGTCAIGFTVTVSGSLTAPTVTATGTICGVNATGVVA